MKTRVPLLLAAFVAAAFLAAPAANAGNASGLDTQEIRAWKLCLWSEQALDNSFDAMICGIPTAP